MADDYNNEVFMRLVDRNGKPIPAECRTEVTTDGDDLILDYFNGEFFSVDDFRIGINVEDEDATADASSAGGGKDQNTNKPAKSKLPQAKFGKWKSATAAEIKDMKFQLKMDDLTVTRRYDLASPVLFQKCAMSEPLTSASLVKRKVTGADMLGTFLRYDFTDLLISHINFQDSNEIKETIQFVFRKLEVSYRTQNPDGSLGSIGHITWDYPAKTRPTGPDR